jgi:8-oxo-dGTP pyrophosphatase MutT (NUDIX family)
MQFTAFIEFLPKIKNQKLWASIAHYKLAPLERISDFQSVEYLASNPRKAAVVMLFYPKNNITHLVLIARKPYQGTHSGQICLPGGKMDDTDTCLQETAIRETFEEIGIEKNKINLVKQLSEIYIPPSHLMVVPFLGYCTETPSFIPDAREVDTIIEFPISELLDDSIIKKVQMKTSYADAIDVPAFVFENHVIWGATAMMLSELKEIVKKVIS